jgi:hypothetical protein
MSAPRRYYRYAYIAATVGAIAIAPLVLPLGLQTLPIAPAYGQSGTTQITPAEDISDDDIASYASAAVAIEEKRTAALEAATDILATADSEADIADVPLSCTASKIADMPDISKSDRVDLRTVLVDFCNEASLIVEENNLTATQFNAITAAHRDDDEVTKRIQAAIKEL